MGPSWDGTSHTPVPVQETRQPTMGCRDPTPQGGTRVRFRSERRTFRPSTCKRGVTLTPRLQSNSVENPHVSGIKDFMVTTLRRGQTQTQLPNFLVLTKEPATYKEDLQVQVLVPSIQSLNSRKVFLRSRGTHDSWRPRRRLRRECVGGRTESTK